jgi:predicted secreted protein
MSDQFSEKRINVKFCVKLGKNSSDTCAVLSETYRGEATKKFKRFYWHKRFRLARTWKMLKEVVVQGLTEPMKMLKK